MTQTLPFARNSVATYTDVNGIVQTAPINVPRNKHYIAGVPTFLYEPVAATNQTLFSRDLTNAGGWVPFGLGAAPTALDSIGLDGTPNSATTVTDNDVANALGRSQQWVIPNDSNPHTVGIWIKKDTNQLRFPEIGLSLTGGTAQNNKVQMNTQTGQAVLRASTGTHPFSVVDAGLWWILLVSCFNNSTGNTVLLLDVLPARGTVLGVANVAALGSMVVGQVQVEFNSLVISSPIFTTNVAVQRAAEVDQLMSAIPFSRASTATYIDYQGIIQTAVVDEIRCRNYVNGFLQGPLIEGALENLLGFTEAFDNPFWTKSTSGIGALPVVTPDFALGPDNKLTADKVVFSAPGNGDTSFLNQNPTVVPGQPYTAAVYVKAATPADIGKQIIMRHAGDAAYGIFTLGPTWLRFIRTEIANDTTGNISIGLRPVAGGGSAGTVTVLMACAQMEPGAQATSYVPRLNAQSSPRAADIYDPTRSGGFSRANGSFIVDNFQVGDEFTPSGFTKNLVPKKVSLVTDKNLFVVDAYLLPEPTILGGALVTHVATVQPVFPAGYPNTFLPLNPRRDTASGVIINATDPSQVAAHPSTVPTKGTVNVNKPWMNYAVKAASALSGRIWRKNT